MKDLRKFLRNISADSSPDRMVRQKCMWNNMQAGGYFRFHPVYKGWSSKDQEPPRVVRDGKYDVVMPECLRSVCFADSKTVFEAPAGRPLQYFDEVIDPALKLAESLWLPQMASIGPEMVVLNIGCGYGRTEEWMFRHVKEICGTDISDYIIEVCRKRFKGIENVGFFPGSGSSLEMFEDERFDFVYCFNVFQHIPRNFTENYLKEMRRVLRKKGHCFFNLLSGVNHDADNGEDNTEWMIGYSHEDAMNLIEKSRLIVNRTFEWKLAHTELSWIWIEASRD